ncbi:MAG TPA: hypothetical protein VM659_13710 [Dongiaceae bacterium]|nr:hypothetical protein [Dongiaceae bacterium]
MRSTPFSRFSFVEAIFGTKVVAISIGPLHQRTMAMADALYDTVRRLDVE